MARLRFDDESAAGVERLRVARERVEKWTRTLEAQLSVRASNALWVVGVWSPAELRYALQKTPNLLRYVRNCGSTTEQELVTWARAGYTKQTCPRCRGAGVLSRPTRRLGRTAPRVDMQGPVETLRGEIAGMEAAMAASGHHKAGADKIVAYRSAIAVLKNWRPQNEG